MAAVALAFFMLGLVAGWLLRRATREYGATTYDSGATWYRSGRIREPVTDGDTVRALCAVRRLTTAYRYREVTIEVRI